MVRLISPPRRSGGVRGGTPVEGVPEDHAADWRQEGDSPLNQHTVRQSHAVCCSPEVVALGGLIPL
jgi:hypothetical protein